MKKNRPKMPTPFRFVSRYHWYKVVGSSCCRQVKICGNKMRDVVLPTHVLSFTEQLYCFEFCSSDFASNLAAVATDKKIILLLIHFPEDSGGFNWERLKDIYNDSRCDSLAFAPNTSLVVMPKTVTFCVASSDFRLRIFRTDLQNSDTVQILQGHSNYINEVAWDSSGDLLASVSDDHSCRVWSAKTHYETAIVFFLSSAGMSVKWHPEEPHKMLVAEKRGVMHLYNVQSQQAVMSVEAQKCPLLSVDWSFQNRLCITALVAGDIVTWDLRRPTPADVKQAHEDGGYTVRIAPHAESVVASIGRPDVTLKVFTAKSRVPLIEAPLKLYGHLAWHQRLPYIGVTSDRKLYFWKVQVK